MDGLIGRIWVRYDEKMKNFVLIITLLFTTLSLSSISFADCEEISEDTSWDMVYRGTVTGYRDPDGKTGDDFEGCEFDRVLILDYSKKVTCATYSYSYSFMPSIEVYSNGYSLQACIDDDLYDVNR